MSIDVEDSRLLAQGGKLPLDHIQGKIEGLLYSQIERNKYHLNREMQSAPQSVTGMRLDEILKGIQDAIHQRIGKMAAAPSVATPTPATVSWTDENVRLLSFYSFLRENPKTGDAYKLCDALRMDADQKIHALMTSQTLPPSDLAAQQMAVVQMVRERIGKVVFAADVLPDKLATKINLGKLEETVRAVAEIVDEDLSGVLKTLQDLNAEANDYPLQDRDMVMYTEKPKEIAKLLLTSNGQLNLGLISAIKTHFFDTSHDLLEYEQGILFVLDRLDPSWQKALDAVQPPESARTAANALVRADLGLAPTAPIGKLECQQVILGALLSQLCQGPVGDCFAVSWAIKKHDEFMQNAFADYAALVQNGYLTRSVNGKPDNFFFETTIADEAMSAEITLYADGTVDEYNHAPFWECPNLISAARQMGILDLASQKDAVIKQVLGSHPAVKTLAWDDLIAATAKVAAGSGQSLDQLLMLGRYGFSLSNNHLLRAWETSLAAMSEARPGDYVRDNITSSVMSVFSSVFASQEKRVTAYQKSLIEETKRVFQKTLNDAFRIVYNGSIPLTHVSSDGSSSSGGFELYQRSVGDLSNKGIRIATPQQFQAFILGIIDKAKETETAKVASVKDRALVSSVIQALHLCAVGKDFMKKVLYAYDDTNKRDSDPVAHYLDLERTPMTSLDGDNPWEVESIDTGKDFTPDIKTIRPKDPGDLLKWLLGLAQWKETTEHYLSDDIPNEEDTGTSPQHAFNIEIEGPEFKDFLGSKLSPDAWIQKTIVAPGLQVSRADMDQGARLLFEKNVRGWLGQQLQNGIPDSLSQEMDNLFKSLNSKVMTVQQFAQRAQDGMVGLFRLNADQTHAISLAFDAILLQSLPAAQSRALQQESVRFAKTNWDSGPKNIFFCCFFNPRTEKVDFGSINEDRTGLQPMDQFEWIDNLQWEVDPSRVKV
ncbi:MAG: hypothetical protein JSS60_06650 [Verrucomicrobia bacterium]|nr:hypothetical protein [Verrucomicrobiota bacterium]